MLTHGANEKSSPPTSGAEYGRGWSPEAQREGLLEAGAGRGENEAVRSRVLRSCCGAFTPPAPNPRLRPEGSLQPPQLLAGHPSTPPPRETRTTRASFPRASSISRCSATSPAFRLNSLVLPHVSMWHQVPSSLESASPKPRPPTSPLFFAGPHTSRNHCPFGFTASAARFGVFGPASISLPRSKTLSGSILPKNVTPSFSAWLPHMLAQPSCSVLPYSHFTLQVNNGRVLVPQSPPSGPALRTPRSPSSPLSTG